MDGRGAGHIRVGYGKKVKLQSEKVAARGASVSRAEDEPPSELKFSVLLPYWPRPANSFMVNSITTNNVGDHGGCKIEDEIQWTLSL